MLARPVLALATACALAGAWAEGLAGTWAPAAACARELAGAEDPAGETDGGSEPAPPSWAAWHARSYEVDLSGDGAPDLLAVGEGAASLVVDGAAAFASPDDWLVSDARVGDLDGDGVPEVVLLVWRQGSYGSSRPFWVDDADDEGFSQHVFVCGWSDGTLRPLWMSSQVGASVERMELRDDGTLVLTERDGRQTAWVWEGWGLKRAEEPAAVAATATLLVTGDVIAHEPVYEGAYDPATRSFDFSSVFDPVRALVAAADVAVAGQETPLVHEPALRSGYPLFATPDTLADALADAGFDVVLAASNHVLDQGEAGLRDTLSAWERHPQVTLLGVHPDADDAASLDVVEANGIRVGMLNYTYGTNGRGLPAGSDLQVDVIGDADALVAAVERADRETDLVACFLHVGEEYASDPTAEQRALVQRLVDAGADLVVCAHSHVAGPWEEVEGAAGNQAVVCWGLGNFAAVQDDVACVLGTCASLVVEKTADGATRIADVELVPTVCHTSRTGEVAVYPLVAYTDELAAEHYLNDLGRLVTLPDLWERYAVQARQVG